MSHIRSCLMLEASKQVYISLLQPLFDHTDVAWGGGGISEGCCKELHRLQNRAAIILWKNTSNDTFHVLNWLTLSSRRKMQKCILVFKCLNNLVAKYLTQYLQGMRICKIMQLHVREGTTCTHQSLNVIRAN